MSKQELRCCLQDRNKNADVKEGVEMLSSGQELKC